MRKKERTKTTTVKDREQQQQPKLVYELNTNNKITIPKKKCKEKKIS